MTNYLFDKQKLVLTVLENRQDQNIIEIVEQNINYIIHRLSENVKEKKTIFDKESILLPRQKTYIQPTTTQKSKWEKKKRDRMIWSDDSKGWILRRDKRKVKAIPPIIEATSKDAYEDVFKKREIQHEIDRSQQKLKRMKNISKQRKIAQKEQQQSGGKR